jgi:DNA-directed RNA polymerase specialized sigma24 family protein
MRVSQNIQEFFYQNDKDVTKLIHKHFKNIILRFSIEDIKNEIYERLIVKQYIEKYRPFRIFVDTEGSQWEFKTADAKFSTYIFTFMRNYILAYYGNKKHYEKWLSLSDFNESGYGHDNGHKISFKEKEIDVCKDSEFNMDIESLLLKLQKKNKNKGTLVCDNDLELSIAKCVDNFGDEGCPEEDLKKIIFKETEEKSNLEEFIFNKIIDDLVERKIIKIEKNNEGSCTYYIDDPVRRSIYNLLRLYLEGYKDKEISQKFKMTVAGVGALKRSLRKELQGIVKNWKE